MFVIEFFRDTLSGFTYYLYLLSCIFVFFFVLGIVADRKREAINNKLKEKKKYDIESGKEAAIAAMETKQVLDVDDSIDAQQFTQNQNPTINSTLNSMSNVPDTKDEKKEEIPNVMVFNSGESNNASSLTSQQQVVNQEKVQEPVVIDSSSVQV